MELSKTTKTGLDVLVADAEYNKRLRSEFSNTITNKDYLVGGINNVFEDNAKLNNTITSLKSELDLKDLMCSNLQIQNENLKVENADLKKKLRVLNKNQER